MYIKSTKAPELQSDTMMMIDYVKGNRLIQELNERYRVNEQEHNTEYNVIIPDDTPKSVTVERNG